MIPPVFPTKQLLFEADGYITTPYKRPGDGTRHRLRRGWYALSADRNTFVDEEVDAVRRKRVLDFTYYKALNGRVLRMNNQSEFCAWAKGGWVRQVTFLDLGFTAGKDDCDKDYDYYYRTQHPENDESLYAEGLAGEGMVNPFAGRPTDAMYGDYFELTSDMEQRVADLDGQVSWQPLEAGAVASGRGKIRFHLYLQSNDILPLKLLTTALAVNVEDPEAGTTKRAAVLLPVDEEDFPLVLSEGEGYEFVFEETVPMRDINEKTIRLHFVVDYEDPWGRTARKVERSYYYKSGW